MSKKPKNEVKAEAAKEGKSATLKLQRLALPLAEHEKNPRKHPAPGSEEWELLRASLADAYFDPLIWNARNGKLVGGHLRQKLLLAEGYTHADCVVVDWPEEQHLAKMIAANRCMGEDDEEGMRLILEDLSQAGFDLHLTGLTEQTFAALNFNPDTAAQATQPAGQPAEGAEQSPGLSAPPSHIKLVQLFFTVENHPEFIAMAEDLMKRYGTTTITDTVLHAVRNEHAQPN